MGEECYSSCPVCLCIDNTVRTVLSMVCVSVFSVLPSRASNELSNAVKLKKSRSWFSLKLLYRQS